MKVVFQRIKEIPWKQAVFLLGFGVSSLLNLLEGPVPLGSLPRLTFPCSSSRPLSFVLVVYSSSIYESLKCARYHLDCRDQDTDFPLQRAWCFSSWGIKVETWSFIEGNLKILLMKGGGSGCF